MPNFSVGDVLEELIEEFYDNLEEGIQNLQREYGDKIERTARNFLRQQDAIASGNLIDSIDNVIQEATLTLFVGTDMPYAASVEFGTRPHVPPIGALLEWAAQKGLPDEVAFAAQEGIARRGGRAQPYLGPAFEIHWRNFVTDLKDVIAEAWEEAGERKYTINA